MSTRRKDLCLDICGWSDVFRKPVGHWHCNGQNAQRPFVEDHRSLEHEGQEVHRLLGGGIRRTPRSYNSTFDEPDLCREDYGDFGIADMQILHGCNWHFEKGDELRSSFSRGAQALPKSCWSGALAVNFAMWRHVCSQRAFKRTNWTNRRSLCKIQYLSGTKTSLQRLRPNVKLATQHTGIDPVQRLNFMPLLVESPTLCLFVVW